MELYPWRFDFIESEGARVYRKRSSENGPFTSSSEELGYNAKRSVFRRTLVRPRIKRKKDGLPTRRGESLHHTAAFKPDTHLNIALNAHPLGIIGIFALE